MRATIVIGINYTYNESDFKDSYVIGVDKGAKFCLDNSIPMDITIGDFDSVDNKVYEKITQTTKTIKLNPIKDETDTKEALEYAKNYDEILILGAIGGKRIEHLFSNIIELVKSDKKIYLKDDNSLIYIENKRSIFKGDYKFVSIFSLDNNTSITLKNMKYPLNNYNLKILDPLCISNEAIGVGEMIVHNGRVIVILSKDDAKWNHFIGI